MQLLTEKELQMDQINLNNKIKLISQIIISKIIRQLAMSKFKLMVDIRR